MRLIISKQKSSNVSTLFFLFAVPSDTDSDVAISTRIADDDTVVICTYASWAAYDNLLPENFDVNLCSHVYYAFVGISENGDVRINDERLEINDGMC